jgi:hypothetical protein
VVNVPTPSPRTHTRTQARTASLRLECAGCGGTRWVLLPGGYVCSVCGSFVKDAELVPVVDS